MAKKRRKRGRQAPVMEIPSLLDLAITPNTDPATLRSIQSRPVLKRILVELMADPYHKFNRAAFCRRFAVTDFEVTKWLRDPDLNTRIRERVNEVMRGGRVLSSLYRKTYRSAMRGNHKDRKLLFEITGEYQPGVRLEHSVVSPEAHFRELEDERKRGVKLIRTRSTTGTPETGS